MATCEIEISSINLCTLSRYVTVQMIIIPDQTDPQKSPVMERCQNFTFYCLKSDLEVERSIFDQTGTKNEILIP